MLKINGDPVKLNLDGSLTLGEGDEAITYPADSLRDQATRDAIGLVDEPAPPRPNDKFYWVGELGADGTYPCEPKDLVDLKKLLVAEVKATANSLLSPTAWMIERAMDPSSGKPVPQNVLDYRADVRSASNDNEAIILSAKAVEALEAFAAKWPEALQ